MKRWAQAGLFMCAMLVSACGHTINTTSNPQPTVAMSASEFTSLPKWIIKAGDSVVFDDPATSGGVHNLLTGKDGNYIAQPGAPDDLNNANGVTFNPGDRNVYKFSTAGTYTITCSIHDAMLVTIIVQP